MRCIITIFLCLMVVGSVGAIDGPIGRRSQIIGGSVSFSGAGGELYENREGDPYMCVTISPTSSIFVEDGFYFGGIVDITFQKQGSAELTEIAFGPTIGYFWGPEIERGESYKGHTLPYLHMFVLYQTWDIGSGLGKIRGWGLGVGCGIVPMISNSVGINLGLTGRYDWVDPSSGWFVEVGAGITAFIWD